MILPYSHPHSPGQGFEFRTRGDQRIIGSSWEPFDADHPRILSV